MASLEDQITKSESDTASMEMDERVDKEQTERNQDLWRAEATAGSTDEHWTSQELPESPIGAEGVFEANGNSESEFETARREATVGFEREYKGRISMPSSTSRSTNSPAHRVSATLSTAESS